MKPILILKTGELPRRVVENLGPYENAFLRIVPEAGVAVALLTNGGDIISLYQELYGRVFDELTDTHLPSLPVPPADPPQIDASRYVGTYSAEVFDLNVSQDEDGRVWIETVPKGMFEELGEQPERDYTILMGANT